MIDRTSFIHGLICVIPLSLGIAINNVIAGAAFGMALWFGREHAQAEYRWIEKFGNHKRANMPWYGGFDPKVWDIGSVLDFLVPFIICTVVVYLKMN